MILHPSFVLPVMPQETPVSYASRVALGIGCSFRALCKRTDIPLQKLYDGSPEAIALLCHVCQLPQDTFAASTFVTASGRRLTLAGQMFSTDQVNRDALRICAVCVGQQLAEGRGFNEISSPREWSITPLHVCDIHSAPMLTIAEPSARLRPDFAARLRDAWREGLARPDSIGATMESGLGHYVRDTLSGVHPDHWLSRLPLYAAIKTAGMIGSIAMHGVHQVVVDLSPADRFEAGRIGYDILGDGEAGLRKVFSECQRDSLAEASSAGLKTTFGKMYLAMSQGKDASYDPLRDVLRRHIVETMPFGPGETVLGQEVTERRVHSARTVAPVLGVSIPTAYKRLRLVGVLDATSDDLVMGQCTFDAQVHASAIRRLASALQRADAGRYLGLKSLEDLTPILDGIPPLNIAETRRIDQIFAKEDLDAFLASLMSRVSSNGTPGLEPIAKVSKRARTSFADIVDMILKGEVAEIGLSPAHKGIMSLMLRKDEILRAAVARRPWLTQTAGAKAINMRDTTLGALVRNKIIPSKGISPVMLQPRDLDAFTRTYISQRDVSRQYRSLRHRDNRYSVVMAITIGRPQARFRQEQNRGAVLSEGCGARGSRSPTDVTLPDLSQTPPIGGVFLCPLRTPSIQRKIKHLWSLSVRRTVGWQIPAIEQPAKLSACYGIGFSTACADL